MTLQEKIDHEFYLTVVPDKLNGALKKASPKDLRAEELIKAFDWEKAPMSPTFWQVQVTKLHNNQEIQTAARTQLNAIRAGAIKWLEEQKSKTKETI